ncbi:hypothetical protein [Dyella sp. A6]|uniref:hypothetical protein n=1 Tax=Dyella aluminiiresistens TaxID=3069105 RepID=UPI002E79B05C|nr:hypothetical protein [Dyella sp. A6]
MTDASRRNFLKAAAWLPLVAPLMRNGSAVPGAGGAVTRATLRLGSGPVGRRADGALASLSYETLQLSDPAFFSADNRPLVELFRQLNPQGVLRIGGNTSDSTVWSGYRGHLPEPRPRKYGPKTNPTYVLHPESLHRLGGFLDATGWKLVFGVNLRIGVPAMAVELGRAVREAVGSHLLAIQIGNEANDYEPDDAAFRAAWLPYAHALSQAGLPLGGPDTGANTDWVIDYARRYARDNVLVSRHYYRDAASRGSIPDMLSGDPGFYAQVERIMQVADAVRRPFYLTEANSYYSGGRDGVSNVFAAALWGADFMLALAQRGVSGICFHGGTLHSVETSLNRATPAHAPEATDLTLRRMAVTSRYAPIAGDLVTGFQPQPLFYGMQLAQRFAGARFLPLQLDSGGANLRAYAAQRGDAYMVALINKDMHRDADVAIRGMPGYRLQRITRLTAPALTNREQIVLDDHGHQAVAGMGDHPDVNVKHGSAAVLYLERMRA